MLMTFLTVAVNAGCLTIMVTGMQPDWSEHEWSVLCVAVWLANLKEFGQRLLSAHHSTPLDIPMRSADTHTLCGH